MERDKAIHLKRLSPLAIETGAGVAVSMEAIPL